MSGPVFDLVAGQWTEQQQDAEADALRTLRAPIPVRPRRPRDVTDWRAVLDFESSATELGIGGSTKALFVRRDFGCSMTRYYQILTEAIRQPEALQYAPATVARLRRLLEARRSVRSLPADGTAGARDGSGLGEGPSRPAPNQRRVL